jgi:hypothetical protein
MDLIVPKDDTILNSKIVDEIELEVNTSVLDKTLNDAEDKNGMILTTIDNPEPDADESVNVVKFDVGRED